MTDVPCGTCTLCCKKMQIILFPNLGEDPREYRTILEEDFSNTYPGKLFHVLERTPEGNCYALGPNGCTIYEKRPRVCRNFDCGEEYRKRDRAQRRRDVKSKMFTVELFERGREIEEIRAIRATKAD
jgi:Fe-S-cluster containining protein